MLNWKQESERREAKEHERMKKVIVGIILASVAWIGGCALFPFYSTVVVGATGALVVGGWCGGMIYGHFSKTTSFNPYVLLFVAGLVFTTYAVVPMTVLRLVVYAFIH